MSNSEAEELRELHMMATVVTPNKNDEETGETGSGFT